MTREPRLPASFQWLNATQFLGALNDNAFKLLVSFALIRAYGAERSSTVVGIAGMLFAVPFLLVTPAAGVLADRLSKRTIVVAAKWLEVLVMAVGVAVFLSGRAPLLYGVLFLMAAQSAFFGPAKYGIIPELVGRDQLSRANSRLVAMSYLAIILGTFGAPVAVKALGGSVQAASWACIAVAAAGTWTALRVRRTPPAGSTRTPSWFVFADVARTLRAVRGDRYLVLALLGAAYFSLVGAFLQLNLIPFGIRHLGLSEVDSGFLFLGAAVGIGLGATVAGRLSGRNVEFGVLPLGALALAAATLAMAGVSRVPAAAAAILAAGLGAGLYIVPLEAFIQFRCPRDRLGEVQAANGFLGWIGVLAGAAALLLFDRVLHLTPAQGFLAVGGLTLVLVAVALAVLPDFVVRFAAVIMTRTIYRIRVLGAEHLPLDGGALLVANHVCTLDALQLLACQQRRIRFVMHRRIYERHVLRPLFRLMGVIPIAMDDPPKRIVASLRAARRALDDGFMVCIFAEGALTRTGLLRGFKPGFERIVRGSRHPVIPVYLGGTWGSVFSLFYRDGHARRAVRVPYPVTVVFGAPLPPGATAPEVRQAVQELSCDGFGDDRLRVPLGRAFVEAARRHGGRTAASDTLGRRLTCRGLLASACALADVLAARTRGERSVGVLLPPSVGGALANLALALLRKTSVNLNFTVPPADLDAALRQAEVRTVVTSRAFLERVAPGRALPRVLYLEELAASLTPRRRLRALLRARFAPAGLLASARGFSPGETATVIFSSGTTGTPKGVRLTHRNLLSNVEALARVLRPRRDDALAATLPLFHAFGYTCGIWLPVLSGLRAAYHPNALDPARIARMVREERCTALFTTPTFLLGLLRRAAPEDLAPLRLVVTGAEKLARGTADAFEARFGLRPLEGYGATELSPVAMLGLPDRGEGPLGQTGHREGSVGQPLPGVAVRIVDPDSGAPLPAGREGLLLVRGPNVMAGYLGQPEATRAALRDGWYVTGDIARVDADGFVFLCDRLARFSKIAGERVPHRHVEEACFPAADPAADPVLAVTAVPDPRRGERLVVLHTEAAGDADALHARAAAAGLPNLWKPARADYYRVDAIPLTGTGKLDVRGLRELAVRLAGVTPPA